MSTLETRLRSRGENNLDFLRFVAAASVILSHCYPLRGLLGEPLRDLTGYLSFGQLGVAIFFVMSGVLITRSWLDRPRPLDFIARRALRILPGLFCAVCFGLLVVGPLATVLPLKVYFGAGPTWTYLGNALVFPLQYGLPGVFRDLPHRAVNGSLWTLPLEALCYGAVLVGGLAGALSRRVFGWLAGALIAYWAIGFVFTVGEAALPGDARLGPARECWLWFLLGALAYVYRDRLVLNRWGALLAAAVFLGTLSTDRGYPCNLGYVAGFPSIAYLVLYAAQVRVPWLPHWGKYGDLSYGMYIYAFPVQQLAIHWLGRGLGTGELFALSLAGTLPLALASWHGVERPMLALAHRRAPAPMPVGG